MLLLEREAEVAAIDAALAAGGSVLLLEGAAGIGKTALLATAAESARSRGMAVLAATAVEVEHELPFGVVRQHLGGGTAAFDAEADFAVVHELYLTYADAAARTPLLVTVDDAQWCDRPSLRLLAYLARRLEGVPLTLVVAVRSGEAPADERLLAAVADAADVVLSPAPLSSDAVGDAAAEALGRDADEEFAAACAAATGGNPFLVGELLAAVRAGDVEPTAANAARVESLRPRGVARAVARRLDALGADAGAAARALAALGDGAKLHRVGSVAGLAPGQARVALDDLQRAGVVEPGALRFRHPLIRAAVYDAMSPAEAARLHAGAAAALAREGEEPEAVAAQLLRCDPVGADWAVRALREAAAGALGRGAPEPAAEFLRRALLEPLDEGARVEVLTAAGTAAFHAGDPRAADHLGAALRLAREPRTEALVALTLSLALIARGDVVEAVDQLERSAARAGGERLAAILDGAALAAGQLDATASASLGARFDRLRAAIDSGQDLPAGALATVAVRAALANEPAADAAALAEQALATDARDHDPLAALAPSFFHICGALLAAERYDRVRELYDLAIADARERGAAVELCIAHSWRALLNLRVGALADAEADAAIATRTADAPLERLFRPLATAVRIEVLIERDTIAEAPADPDAGDSIYAALHAYALARLACAERRHEEGAEALLRAGERLTRLGATSPSAAAWRSEAALALLALGRDAEAREHAAEELRLARELGTAPRALGIALRAAGLANRDSDLLAEACAVLAPSPARLEHARALTDHGAALRRAGRRAEAREQLKGALDIATRLGATSLQERATTELKAAGGRPRKPFRTGREALTASELRVAELAAGGMTNRQIAQALFVTPRTVEGHLTQVYGKLGASGRSGLADALADRP